MRKIICMMLIAVIFLLPMCNTAFAATTDSLVISSLPAEVQLGEEACITLTVEQNPGFMAIIFYPVITDANGTPMTWEWDADQSNTQLVTDRNRPFFTLDVEKNILLISGEDCDTMGTGILMDVYIMVPKDAAQGTYTVSFQLYQGQCMNAKFESVSVNLPTVTLAVKCLHTNTTQVQEQKPTGTEPGYTAGVFCNDCQTYISGHERIPTTSHTYVPVVTAPSCLEEGFTTYTCSTCGDSYVADAVEPLGHRFTDYQSNQDASCTEDGTETAQCDRCGAQDTRVHQNSALGHREVVDAGYAATCTTPGLSDGKHCAVCDEILVAQQEIPSGNHLFGEWVTSKVATCSEEGERTRRCTVCDASETEVVDKKPHGVAVMEAVAPGCTTPGLTEGTYCPGCQLVFATQEEILPAGHSFGDWMRATDNETSVEIRICSGCGEQETRSVDPSLAKPEKHNIVPAVVVTVIVGGSVALFFLLRKKRI